MLIEASARCRAELGACSDEAVTWQPFRMGHSIGGIFMHLTATELECLHALGGRAMTKAERALLVPEDSKVAEGRWPSPLSWPLAQYHELQDSVRGELVQRILHIGDADKAFEWQGRNQSLREIVSGLIHQESYRTGQMALHKLHHGWNGSEPL